MLSPFARFTYICTNFIYVVPQLVYGTHIKHATPPYSYSIHDFSKYWEVIELKRDKVPNLIKISEKLRTAV